MKTSTKRATNFRPTIGRIAMALTLAAVMGGISVAPAIAKDNDRRNERGHERGHERDGRGYQHNYYYSQPVYAPPPVYYAPQQSPGVSFFFPLDLRR